MFWKLRKNLCERYRHRDDRHSQAGERQARDVVADQRGTHFAVASESKVEDTTNRIERIFEAVKRVRMVPLEGVFVRNVKKQGQFIGPGGIAVSGEEVFVCDHYSNRVQVFRLDGTYRRQWGRQAGEGQFDPPLGIAVSGEEVFVCDMNNHRVQVFI